MSRARLLPRRQRDDCARAIAALNALAGDGAVLVATVQRPWASATFSGFRLSATFDFPAAAGAGERFCEALPDHEFTLPRVLVADAVVVWKSRQFVPVDRLTCRVDLLLLDED